MDTMVAAFKLNEFMVVAGRSITDRQERNRFSDLVSFLYKVHGRKSLPLTYVNQKLASFGIVYTGDTYQGV